jgi:flagellar FliJ protein
MAKFVYRMQNILNMKQKLENQAKAAYGLADKKYQEEQAKLQELLVRKSGYDRRLKELMNGIINLEEVHHAKAASESMKVLIRRQMVEVHKAQLELEAARKQLIDVRKERKMHEKLREKAYDAYLVEENRREGKEVDQLVSYTYNAK